MHFSILLCIQIFVALVFLIFMLVYSGAYIYSEMDARMMGLKCPLKISRGKRRRAYQKKKMQRDCNSVFPLDDRICIRCFVHCENGAVHPNKHI